MPVSYGESPTVPSTSSRHSKGEVTYPLRSLGKTPGVRDFLGTPSTVSQQQEIPVLPHPFTLWWPSPFQPPSSIPARREENAWTGKLTEISAIAAGLKIAPARSPFRSPNNWLGQLPPNCQGWLLIPEQHQTLVKVALEAFWQERKVTFYYTLPDCLVTRLNWQRENRQSLPTVRGGQVIREEDVPPGMRKEKGPFGDRLVPAK